MSPPAIPIAPGDVFGRLTVLASAGPDKHGALRYDARCECGERTTVRGVDLTHGRTKSCGCLARDAHTTHGHTVGDASPTYRTWHAMVERCTNPKHASYHRYGGRGITVHAPWLTFENFLREVGERPTPKHEIDRENNDGNYEPGNVRWATRAQQARNTSRTRNVTIGGETLCLTDWAHRFGLPPGVVRARVHLGWSVERALKTPVGPHGGGSRHVG